MQAALGGSSATAGQPVKDESDRWLRKRERAQLRHGIYH